MKTLGRLLRRVGNHRFFRCFLGLILFLVLLDFLFPFKPSVRYSVQMEDKNGELLHAFLSPDDKWRLYATEREITPMLRKTLLYKEDKYFYYHPGVNPVSIARAAFQNLLTGKRTSGASTITMQVVRLLRPARRTYLNKSLEVWRALQLEFHFSKDEILQMYFNLVPYGGNIEGIKAAAICYYGKSPALLSLAEVTALTIIPNRPSSLRPGQKNAHLQKERNKWLVRFREEKLFDAGTVGYALEEPVEIFRREGRKEAPHLSRRLKKEDADVPVLRTTLIRQKQIMVEGIVKSSIARLKSLGVQNAAVMVVDNESMEVQAYVGSADFDNPFDGGQVDGIRAVRSPGSTLKPLLYATAFDRGIITPLSVINDVPVNFSGYEPENFDRKFNGPVTAEFALSNSLNIPSVRILKDMGLPVFTAQLKKSGYVTVTKQEQDLGLSMILGGCGVTLEELTRQFAAFANEGRQRPLRYISRAAGLKDTVSRGFLVSPEAAYLITEVLSKTTRPDLPQNFDNTFHLPRIAWKTGTSFGKRDAWSIGYNRRYTIGVWVGNFSGEGVPELSGANVATPLLFKVFNALDYNSPKGWYKIPGKLSVRKVCSVSGDIPGEACSSQVLGRFIEGISPHVRCRHSRNVFVSVSGNVSYCTYCVPGHGYLKKSFPNLEPALISFYEQKKIPYEKAPPHFQECVHVFGMAAPTITSPNQGSEYYLQEGAGQQIQLSCQAPGLVREVYWYVNDRLVATSSPSLPVFISPPVGAVKISCSDDMGNNSDIRIIVKKM